MKNKLEFLRAAAVLAGALLTISPPALRAAERKKEHGEHGHSEMAKPASAAAALDALHKIHAELTAQVKGKQLAAVHETTEKLTAAASALPGLSRDLPADKAKRLEGAVKNLAKALDALHDAADDGNQAGSEQRLKTIDSLVAMISSHYRGAGGAAKKGDHDH